MVATVELVHERHVALTRLILQGHTCILKHRLVSKLVNQVCGVLVNKLDLVEIELVEIAIDEALTRLVDLRRGLLDSDVQILLNLGASNILNVQNEFKQVFEGLVWVADDVLVADDVHWNFGVNPEFMEVLPHGDVLLDELGPKRVELLIVVVVDRSIVRARAYHVEQRCNRVQGISY